MWVGEVIQRRFFVSTERKELLTAFLWLLIRPWISHGAPFVKYLWWNFFFTLFSVSTFISDKCSIKINYFESPSVSKGCFFGEFIAFLRTSGMKGLNRGCDKLILRFLLIFKENLFFLEELGWYFKLFNSMNFIPWYFFWTLCFRHSWIFFKKN